MGVNVVIWPGLQRPSSVTAARSRPQTPFDPPPPGATATTPFPVPAFPTARRCGPHAGVSSRGSIYMAAAQPRPSAAGVPAVGALAACSRNSHPRGGKSARAPARAPGLRGRPTRCVMAPRLRGKHPARGAVAPQGLAPLRGGTAASHPPRPRGSRPAPAARPRAAAPAPRPRFCGHPGAPGRHDRAGARLTRLVLAVCRRRTPAGGSWGNLRPRRLRWPARPAQTFVFKPQFPFTVPWRRLRPIPAKGPPPPVRRSPPPWRPNSPAGRHGRVLGPARTPAPGGAGGPGARR
jgi:hypothetical protein